ncbi:MAG: ATP-binding protein [Planctomycetota bacterium]
MVFLDSTGFLAMVGLLAQCGLAWLLVAVFAMLGQCRPRPAWTRHLLLGFVALAVGLTAIGTRFFLSNTAYAAWLEEGALVPRASYALYHGCKMLFVWQLLQAIARIRGRRRSWGRGLPGLLVLYGVVTGLAAATVEVMLLCQIAVIAPLQAWGGLQLLRLHRSRRDPGSAIAGAALLLWAGLWLAYAGPMIGIVGEGSATAVWVALARLSAFCDLTAQTALGAGLIVLLLQDAHEAKLAALAERDCMREALARDQRLRTIGTLVSGVAHELNNPLTSVLGYADDLASDDAGERQRAAQIVREQAERCRGIVRNLTILAGQRSPSRTAVQVQACVERVVRGFGPQSAEAEVTIDVRCDPGLPDLLADPVAIEQILSNLLANAIQATPCGGRVTVSASGRPGVIEVTVADTGSGVAPESAPHLFEPFFTTKPTGSGTGLGLALARALARAHGGDLRLAASTAGACFVLTLPVTAPVGVADVANVSRPLRGTGLRLLVVDDEPLVRRLIGRFAALRGWEVEEVESGDRALALLDTDVPAFDAVVCDLRMPGVSGIDLHDRLAREAPDLLRRFVFITGDLASADAASFARRCFCPLVPKPFDVKGLLREVEKVAVAA